MFGEEEKDISQEEIPNEVAVILRRKRMLADEAINRLNTAVISKFDRLSLRQAYQEGDEKTIHKLQNEISTKMLGPDFHEKITRFEFETLGDLQKMGYENFVKYFDLCQPIVKEVFFEGLRCTGQVFAECQDDRFGLL